MAMTLEQEVKALRVKCAGSLANNLCPDHRDKQTGKPCLACTIERLEAKIAHISTRAIGTAQEEWTVTVDPVAMRDYDDACQVKLHCGHQHFPVGDAHETREEGEWYARQLRIALHIPAPPTDGEG